MTDIQFIAHDDFITLGELSLIAECSLGTFIVNGQETNQKKLFCQTDGTGEASVSIVGPDVGGDGELTLFLRESGRKIAVQPYHFKATAYYALNFKVISDYAMAESGLGNKVKAILTGTGSGVNLSGRKLDLSVTGLASFEKDSKVQTTSMTTDTTGNVSFELYDTNKNGETVTLTGFLEDSKTAHATEPIHFQRNLDCDTTPPVDGKYIRTVLTYSINNQQYLFRQNECDHLVTVHKLVSGGMMTDQTSTGQKWTNFYDLIFPFLLGEDQYIFGLAANFVNKSNSKYKSYWIVAKIDEKGHKIIVDRGYWDSAYDVGFAYAIGDSQFIYLHSKDQDENGKCPYVIRNILPNGQMGKIIEESSWDNFYEATFFFSMEGQAYFYGQSRVNFAFFAYELNNDGKVGPQTKSGSWADYYDSQFPYVIDGVYYYSGQRFDDKLWFVSDIYAGGLPQRRIIHSAEWKNIYQYQVPFSVDDGQYYFRQDQTKNHWRITKLLPGPNMGNDTDSNDNH
ncbi:hypothetical protein Xmau_00483 [Xenorhabdus mauleonii]|uniref:Uncharacterized protein n=1 Tax=Xenorhabdus mauleonii TaxID=351675 RepID=A0A1I3J3V9_9GAMM|nr:hypothetical protein [Xenorhabdus mauleonii]PHM46087.1 hypothetical protein Xmau_00483 [Xenorhabdus mauleonii]SFI54952.1 hypothetical protein SAMN05421680_10278 [Xenorhabdus mauleonii]